MKLIPAIDLIDGKCVRLTQGDYAQKKIYNDSPLDMALQFQDAGIERLHLVDLDGAKAGTVVNWQVLETLCKGTNMEIDFGGGVKLEDDVQRILDTGARWVTVGSVAAKQPDMMYAWLENYGADKFFLGADVRDGMIAVHGWQQTTSWDVFDFIRTYMQKGLNDIFCTDISKDGKLEGPATDLYRAIIESSPGIQLVASGGVSSLEDLYLLAEVGCSGAIIGKAIYEGLISLEDINSFHA